jgi:hypothetical protein
MILLRSYIILIFLVLFSFFLNGQGPSFDQLSAFRAPEKEYPDSSELKSPLITDPGPGKIIFATAFRWNRTGPTGGYWEENQTDDFIFRPVFSNVSSYRLQVYNRWGLLVYESSDLYKGWDGYLRNGDLAPQGVYVWKVKGKYNDGSVFDKMGDVTFIY